uniref:Uncharacterized protein n=1 Tax=Megaselia scalaris TaxID=36166 RepID=T1GY10_MEGSC
MSTKFVSISPNLGIRVPSESTSSATSSDEILSVGCRGKKRRLDHLTWEEKKIEESSCCSNIKRPQEG